MTKMESLGWTGYVSHLHSMRVLGRAKAVLQGLLDGVLHELLVFATQVSSQPMGIHGVRADHVRKSLRRYAGNAEPPHHLQYPAAECGRREWYHKRFCDPRRLFQSYRRPFP